MASFLPLWQVWAKVVAKATTPPLCFIVFVFPSCTMRPTASESNPSTFGKCWPRKCSILVSKTRSHPETVLLFAPLFLVYLHHPRACSIIPRIGLSSPHAPRQKRVGKSKCHRWRVWLRTRRHTCSLLWPPWTMATFLTCVFAMRVWGLHPCLD